MSGGGGGGGGGTGHHTGAAGSERKPFWHVDVRSAAAPPPKWSASTAARRTTRDVWGFGDANPASSGAAAGARGRRTSGAEHARWSNDGGSELGSGGGGSKVGKRSGRDEGEGFDPSPSHPCEHAHGAYDGPAGEDEPPEPLYAEEGYWDDEEDLGWAGAGGCGVGDGGGYRDPGDVYSLGRSTVAGDVAWFHRCSAGGGGAGESGERARRDSGEPTHRWSASQTVSRWGAAPAPYSQTVSAPAPYSQAADAEGRTRQDLNRHPDLDPLSDRSSEDVTDPDDLDEHSMGHADGPPPCAGTWLTGFGGARGGGGGYAASPRWNTTGGGRAAGGDACGGRAEYPRVNAASRGGGAGGGGGGGAADFEVDLLDASELERRGADFEVEEEEDSVGGDLDGGVNPLARRRAVGGVKRDGGGGVSSFQRSRRRRRKGGARTKRRPAGGIPDGQENVGAIPAAAAAAAAPPRKRPTPLDEPRVPHTKLPKKVFTQATLAFG